MSFKRNESQQLTLHDSFINLSPPLSENATEFLVSGICGYCVSRN